MFRLPCPPTTLRWTARCTQQYNIIQLHCYRIIRIVRVSSLGLSRDELLLTKYNLIKTFFTFPRQNGKRGKYVKSNFSNFRHYRQVYHDCAKFRVPRVGTFRTCFASRKFQCCRYSLLNSSTILDAGRHCNTKL